MTLPGNPEFEDRVGLLERARTEGPKGLLLGVADMFLPRADPHNRGLSDLLTQYVEFSRIGDVLDLKAALDPHSGLDPLERALAALPFVGGSVAVAYGGRRVATRYRARRLAQPNMLPPPTQPLDAPASDMSSVPAKPAYVLNDAELRDLERAASTRGYTVKYPRSARIWHAGNWDELAHAWAGPGRKSVTNAEVRGIGHAVLALDPGRYAPDADLDTQAFVAAKFALARWQAAVDAGLLKTTKRPGDLTPTDIAELAEFEVLLGRLAGPDNVVSPVARIGEVRIEDGQVIVVLDIPTVLLPGRVWDWGRALPLDQAALLKRYEALYFPALQGLFAANLLSAAQRPALDATGQPVTLQGRDADWYRRTNKSLRRLAEVTGQPISVIAAVFSALSPRTAWLPLNFVAGVHITLRASRPDLVPGSDPYLRVFREVLEAGDWQHDLWAELSQSMRKRWGGGKRLNENPDPEAAVEAMVAHYGDPANLGDISEGFPGVKSATFDYAEALLLGIPPHVILRWLKTGSFHWNMLDPESSPVTIDVHLASLTNGSAWLRSVGPVSQRRITEQAPATHPVTGDVVTVEDIEAARARLEAAGWDPDRINEFIRRLHAAPTARTTEAYLAHAEALRLVADAVGVDPATYQAFVWAIARADRFKETARSVAAASDPATAKALGESLTPSPALIYILEGGSSLERSVVGYLAHPSDGWSGVKPSETRGRSLRLVAMKDGTVEIWADPSDPALAEALRHVYPSGIKQGKLELHVPRKPREVLSAEAETREALAPEEQPKSGLVRAWTVDDGWQHPGFAAGDWVVVAVPRHALPQVRVLLESQRLPLEFSEARVRVTHTYPGTVAADVDWSALRGATLREFLNRADWTAIEAGRKELDAAVNAERHAKLKKDLEAAGATFVETDGYWEGSPSSSFLVIGLTPQQRLDLMLKYEQDSVATAHGIYFADGTFLEQTGILFGDAARAQTGYTVLPNGEAFSLELGDSHHIPADEYRETGEGTLSPLYQTEEALTEVAVRVTGEFGGLNWHEASELISALRKLGTVRVYTHGSLVEPGWVRARETVWHDSAGNWGSVTSADGVHGANDVAVWYPPETAAGLGIGWARDLNQVPVTIDPHVGVAWVGQEVGFGDLDLVPDGMEVVGAGVWDLTAGGVPLRDQVLLLDLNGPVPMLRPDWASDTPVSPGVVRVKWGEGVVEAIDGRDEIAARELLGRFEPVKEVTRPVPSEVDVPHGDLGAAAEYRAPVTEADAAASSRIRDSLGVEVTIALENVPEAIRNQVVEVFTGLFGDGARFRAFQERFGPLNPSGLRWLKDISTGPLPGNYLAVHFPLKNSRILLSYELIESHARSGAPLSAGYRPPRYSPAELVLVHELGHYIAHVAGVDFGVAAPKGPSVDWGDLLRKHRVGHLSMSQQEVYGRWGSYAFSEPPPEWWAELWVKAVYEPHLLNRQEQALVRDILRRYAAAAGGK